MIPLREHARQARITPLCHYLRLCGEPVGTDCIAVGENSIDQWRIIKGAGEGLPVMRLIIESDKAGTK